MSPLGKSSQDKNALDTLPEVPELLDVAVTALGVVVGFPLLTALALRHVTSAHSIVFVGLLPLCTASFAVLRAGERPRPAFWLFSVVGAAFVVGYAVIAWLLRYLTTHSMAIFVWYRVIVGAGVLTLTAAGLISV